MPQCRLNSIRTLSIALHDARGSSGVTQHRSQHTANSETAAAGQTNHTAPCPCGLLRPTACFEGWTRLWEPPPMSSSRCCWYVGSRVFVSKYQRRRKKKRLTENSICHPNGICNCTTHCCFYVFYTIPLYLLFIFIQVSKEMCFLKCLSWLKRKKKEETPEPAAEQTFLSLDSWAIQAACA